MPSKTPVVGLNQWLGTDQFLREGFNADNLKTEQAVEALQTQQNSLRANLEGKYQYLSQTVHDLLLMQQAEAYYTDSRLALICDGFGGLNKVLSMDSGVGIVPASRALTLGTFVPPVNFASSNFGNRTEVRAGNSYTMSFSLAYSGGLTSLYSLLYTGTSTVPSLALSLYEINPCTGQRQFVKSITHNTTHVSSDGAGVTYHFGGVYVRSGNYELDIVPDRTVSFYHNITAVAYTDFTCAAGGCTSIPFTLPNLSATGLRAIVRHSVEGSVSLAVHTGAGKYTLPRTATRDGFTATGEPCKLSEYALDGLPAAALSGALSVALGLAASGGKMAVYSYAVYLV